MGTESRIRDMLESTARAGAALAWYYRTRPNAWRDLAAPGLGVFLAFFLSLAWGPLGLLVAFGVVGAFSVYAIRLIQEMRSLAIEASADIELKAEEVPFLRWIAEENSTESPAEAPVSETAGPEPELEPAPERAAEQKPEPVAGPEPAAEPAPGRPPPNRLTPGRPTLVAVDPSPEPPSSTPPAAEQEAPDDSSVLERAVAASASNRPPRETLGTNAPDSRRPGPRFFEAGLRPRLRGYVRYR